MAPSLTTHESAGNLQPAFEGLAVEDRLGAFEHGLGEDMGRLLLRLLGNRRADPDDPAAHANAREVA